MTPQQPQDINDGQSAAEYQSSDLASSNDPDADQQMQDESSSPSTLVFSGNPAEYTAQAEVTAN